MDVSVAEEYLRCSNCNSVVLKQRNCPKCGKVLLKSLRDIQTSVEENDLDKKTMKELEEDVRGTAETTSAQLEKLRLKNKRLENERNSIISDEEVDTGVFTEEEIGDTNVKDIDLDEEDLAEKDKSSYTFTPDKFTAETAQKIAKNVKYEAHLVKLLRDGDITKDSFLSLYKGIADDTHKLIQRRAEMLSEVEEAIKGHRSIVEAAVQGMKLLDVRKSIEDASEEEYEVKAAALNWDIDHHGKRIDEETEKATYLRQLGKFMGQGELEKLAGYLENSGEVISKLNIGDEVKERIKRSIQEVSSLLKESANSH